MSTSENLFEILDSIEQDVLSLADAIENYAASLEEIRRMIVDESPSKEVLEFIDETKEFIRSEVLNEE